LNRLRTHYDNLKVSRDAPDFVIRAAYKTLTQKYHPDKNPSADAARIMQLINRSYGVLSDPDLRAEHDAWIRSQEANAGHRPEPASTQEEGESTETPHQPHSSGKRPVVFPAGGSAPAASLSVCLLKVVSDRSRGRCGDQAHLALGPTVSGTFARSGVSIAWLFVLYGLAMDSRWTVDARAWLGGASALFGIYFGAQLHKLHLFRNRPFRPSLNITPLYVVETTWDRVSYWPISLVRGIQAINHHRNGGYTHTGFDLEFSDDERGYVTNCRHTYASIVNSLNGARERYLAAEQRSNQAILDSVDELKNSQLPDAPGHLPKGYGFLAGWLGGCLAFLLVFFILALLNQEQSTGRTRSTNGVAPPSPPGYQSQPPTPEKTRIPAETARPPTDHIAERIGASRIPEGPAYIRDEPMVRTGGLSTVTVDNARTSDDVLVKLVAVTGTRAWAARTFFIPAGRQFTVKGISPGTYEIRYMDRYSGAASRSEAFTLEETETADGTEYSNMTLTLYKVAGGNMHMQSIDPSEF
jgi:hypothetical protein